MEYDKYNNEIFKEFEEKNIIYMNSKHDDERYMINKGFIPHDVTEEICNYPQYLSHGAYGVCTLNNDGNCVMKEFIPENVSKMKYASQVQTFLSEVKCMNELHGVEGVQKLEMVTVDISSQLLKIYTDYCGKPLLEFFENQGDIESIKVINAIKKFSRTLTDMKERKVGHFDLHPENLTACIKNDDDEINFRVIDFGTGHTFRDDGKLIYSEVEDMKGFCKDMLILEKHNKGLFDDAESKVNLRNFMLEIVEGRNENTSEELERLCEIYLKIKEDETNTEGYSMYSAFKKDKKKKRKLRNKEIIANFSNLKFSY